MSNLRNVFFATSAVLALSACSSSGGGIAQATLLPDGSVAPPRNLQLLDISYLHPSSGDGVNETYDVATVAATFTTETNGANVIQTIDRLGFGQNNTMTYDASANTFTFDVTTANTSLQETFGFMLLANPVDGETQPYSQGAVLIAANPSWFGLGAGFQGDPAGAETYIEGLSTDEKASFDALVAAWIDGTDYFSYSSNGVTYDQLKLENNAGQTYYTTLGLWSRTVGTETTNGVVVFGQRTPQFNVPRTGSVNYNGTIGGYLVLQNTVHYMTGGANFDFNFANSNVDFTLLPQLGDIGIDGGAVFFDYDTFTGSGRIDGATFTGAFTSDTDPDVTGDLEGAFFGISAEEVAGTFEFGNQNVSGIGGFVADREGGTPGAGE